MMDEIYRKDFAKRLCDLIERSSYNQKELSKALGLGVSTVNGWCKGSYMPRIDKMEELCKLLGCTRTYLVEGKETVTRNLTDDEAEMLMYYRKLSAINKGKLLGQMAALDQEKRDSLELKLSRLDDKQALLVNAVANLPVDKLKQLNDLLGI